MSLNPRDLTQGGQVAFMRLKMFLQINNLISYYVIMGTVLFGIAVLLMRMSIQNLTNGIIYWFVRVMSPFTEKMVSQPVYTIRYYEHNLQYSARQVLSDSYTMYCGQLLKQELIIAGCAALLIAFLATLAVYWYLGRAGRKQSEDEIIGGRVLCESPKEVARMMKKRGEASDIRIDGLPLKLDSEIQNFAMHGTVGSGKSQLMRKILKQLRDRGDLVIIYDKGCTFVEDFYDESRDTPVAGEQTLTPEQLALVRTDIIEAIRDDWMGRTPEAQQQTLVVAELNADRHAINDAIHTARHEKGDTGAEERTFTVLEPLRVPDNALRAAETFAEYTGTVAMMNERYWTVAEVDTQDAVVTLRNADGESVLISPQQNTAQDISLFTPRDLTLSQGDRVRFTRSDTDRGYMANSLWEVAGFTDDGAIRFRQGDQEKIVDPQAMTEDRHIDLAYALTVYGVQGASERFAIALTGTEGGRKRMASLESTYVTLSRAKEHVQVYTDDLAGWSADARHSNAGQTAHDLLHQKSDHESDTGNRLLATASRLDKTALGRRVLAENGLEGETMARFIAAGKKYPSPYVALPAWTRHGKAAGALLTEIRIEDDGMRVVLSDESRLRGGEDAQFAGLQASRNGQTLIADDAQTALRLAQENPESGVVIRLHGEERLLNAARLTGGRITEPDEVARSVRSVAEAESAAKAEDPITLPPDKQQKLAEAQEKAARELAEQARQELLPALPGTEGDKPDPLLSASDERRLRDGTERETRELDEAVREAVAEGREPRQQVRDQMQRTEREWVVNVPEKEIELEKTLGGD
ncbi:hypothetical protein DOF42_22305 [Salmonella enterica]|nr:hypothetical protein [Salmonella enterica]EAW1256125.1 hypothetical protein [Salmonella enterica subsp. enterica]EDB5723292.1 type IV secretion system DNA-binding domain-containing protein [Salmonella enterica subsp. enterica serovar Rubislaw]EBO4819001.1 hypothetical protein [Salmonella enterica]EBQ0855972.1 hypothetical protein [Salmonella enterica]